MEETGASSRRNPKKNSLRKAIWKTVTGRGSQKNSTPNSEAATGRIPSIVDASLRRDSGSSIKVGTDESPSIGKTRTGALETSGVGDDTRSNTLRTPTDLDESQRGPAPVLENPYPPSLHQLPSSVSVPEFSQVGRDANSVVLVSNTPAVEKNDLGQQEPLLPFTSGSERLEALKDPVSEHPLPNPAARSPEDTDIPALQVMPNASNVQMGNVTMNVAGRDLHRTTVHNNIYIQALPEAEAKVSLEDIERWLEYRSFRETYRISQDQRMPETGNWLLESSEFKAFVEEVPVVLWGEGMPGSGKTVLAGAIVHLLKQRVRGLPNIAVAYAFLRFTEEYSLREISASLFCQIVRSCPKALEFVRPIFLRCQAYDEELSTGDLLKAFHAVVTLLEKVHIVIDGLDEVDDALKDDVLGFLMRLDRSNVLILSRPLPSLVALYAPSSVRIAIRAANEDIERFVDEKVQTSARLKRLLGCDIAKVKELSSRIASRSNGMFIIARLQMEELQSQGPSCVDELFQAIDQLPSGILEMYKVAINRIERSSRTDASLAKQAFTWLLTVVEPLCSEDLEYALSFCFEKLVFQESRTFSRDSILYASGGLVEVQEVSRSRSQTRETLVGDSEYRFIHYTTEECLGSIHRSWFSLDPDNLLSLACISHLIHAVGNPESHGGRFETFWVKIRSTPFLQYAYKHWTDHTRKACQGGIVPSSVLAIVRRCSTFPVVLDDTVYSVPLSSVAQSWTLKEFDLSESLPPLTPEEEGILHESIYDRTDLAYHIGRAMSGYRSVIDRTTEQLALPQACHNLVRALWKYINSLGDPFDYPLNEVIALEQRAIDCTPHGHPQLPALITNLGILFHHNSRCRSGTPADFAQSLSCFKGAATSSFGPPYLQLSAAVLWVDHLYRQDPQSSDLPPAIESARSIMAFASGLNSVLGRRFQDPLLPDLSRLSSQAASVSLHTQKIGGALEWLEERHVLLWDRLFETRRSKAFDYLRFFDPQLSDDLFRSAELLLEVVPERCGFSNLHMTLANLPSNSDPTSSLQVDARRNIELHEEWGRLLQRVRSIPALETFLQPQPFTPLLAGLPPTGYVIVIHTHHDRCDAIALSSELKGPHHIPLPNFTLKKVDALYHSFKALQIMHGVAGDWNHAYESEASYEGREVTRAKTREAWQKHTVFDVLETLWIDLVRPVIASLGLSRIKGVDDEYNPARPLPRVWWCVTGQLSLLPIHAAGIYGTREANECLMDYAISSYTPSVTSLVEQVERSRTTTPRPTTPGILLAGQSSVPGMPPMPGIRQEIHAAAHQAGLRGGLVFKADDLTTEALLEKLSIYSCVHLACHISVNPTDPSKSLFHLTNSPLFLHDIAKSLRVAVGETANNNLDLAFVTGGESCALKAAPFQGVQDSQAFHLGAAMLAAGYRRSVTTMWSVADRYAPQVASDFYEYLWNHLEEEAGPMPTSLFDGARSAEALHHSILRIKDRLDCSENSFFVWAPYVHWGY